MKRPFVSRARYERDVYNLAMLSSINTALLEMRMILDAVLPPKRRDNVVPFERR